MQIHASCVAREEAGVLLLGPPGSGKSDLALRLLEHGFMLVADDRVEIEGGIARPPPHLAGLLEVRGLGIVRLAHAAEASLRSPSASAGPSNGCHSQRGRGAWPAPDLARSGRSVGRGAGSAGARLCAGRVAQIAGAFA